MKPATAPPAAPARITQRQVDAASGSVHAEADVGGGDRAGDELALAADVEHAGRKPSADAEPARISGVAATRVSEIGVNSGVQPWPVETAWPRRRAEDRAGEQIAE